MTTETTSQPASRFATKLSAFRAGLNKDEQELLDAIVSGDVEAHAAAVDWYGKVVSDKSDDVVEAHAMARDRFSPKAGEEADVEAHKLPRDKYAPKAGEGEDVEAHAKADGKVAARLAFKFNPARSAYEIGDGTEDDVEAHRMLMPKVADAKVDAKQP